MIGRNSEVQLLDSAVDSVRRLAHTHTVLVRGRAGLGKSTLVVPWAAAQRKSGSFALISGADRTDCNVPLAAFRDAVAEARAAGPASKIDLALVRFESSLGASSSQPRNPPLAAFAELLQVASARRRPPLVVLDDLHVADPDTLALCAALIRGHLGPPVTVVVTMRPGYHDVTDDIEALVERQATRGHSTIIDLEALDEDHVGQMLTEILNAAPTPQLRAQTFHQSGGNPLFVRLIADQLISSSALVRVANRYDARSGWSPRTPRLLLRRLTVPGTAEAMVGASLAAMGTGTTPQIGAIARGAQLPDDEVHQHIDAMISKGLIARSFSGFEFAHPLIREAFSAAIGAQAKTEIHRRIATYLLDHSQSSATVDHFELATHLVLGREELSGPTLAAVLEAANSALGSAPMTAAAWFSAARQCVPADDPHRGQLFAYELLCLAISSRMREGVVVAEQALREIPPEDRSPQLIELVCAPMFGARCNDKAIAAIQALAPDLRTLTIRALYTSFLVSSFRHREAARHYDALFDDATREAESLDPLTATYLMFWPAMCGRTEQFDQVLTWVKQAESRADSSILGFLRNLATIWTRSSSRCVDLSSPTADPTGTGDNHDAPPATDYAGTAASGLAYEQYLGGKWNAALDSLPDDLADLQASGNMVGYEFPGALCALMYTSRGQLGEAKHILDTIGDPSGGFYSLVKSAQGTLLLAESGAEDCLAVTGPALEKAYECGLTYFSDVLAEIVCDCLLDLNREEEASAIAQRTIEWMHPLGSPMAEITLDRIRARVDGDIEAAARSAQASAACGYVFEEAQSRYVLGLLGQSPAENLRAAHSTFGRLRAATERSKVEAAMRQHGIGVPRLRAGPDTLTRVEGNIVRLVAQGLTNRHIAERLRYSPKTIEMHLGRVYARTGHSGRVAAAQAFNVGDLTIIDE